jgi:hypothetical protein
MLLLGVASLALAIVLLVTSHVIIGGVLLAVAGIFFALFAGLAHRLPDTTTTRVSRGALGAVRARAGFAVEAVAVHSSARMELYKLRRELPELRAQRAECARVFGEAVYAGDTKARRPPVRGWRSWTG